MKSAPRTDTPQQLALLDDAISAKVPSQFRLSTDTRRLGLRQVALMREQLLEQAARHRARALPVRAATMAIEHRDAA